MNQPALQAMRFSLLLFYKFDQITSAKCYVCFRKYTDLQKAVIWKNQKKNHGFRNLRSFARGFRNPRGFARGFRNLRSFARGIRNAGSLIFPVESRIVGSGIWNLTNDWSPKSISSIRDWNSVPGIRNPWRGIWNPRQSWIPCI